VFLMSEVPLYWQGSHAVRGVGFRFRGLGHGRTEVSRSQETAPPPRTTTGP